MSKENNERERAMKDAQPKHEINFNDFQNHFKLCSRPLGDRTRQSDESVIENGNVRASVDVMFCDFRWRIRNFIFVLTSSMNGHGMAFEVWGRESHFHVNRNMPETIRKTDSGYYTYHNSIYSSLSQTKEMSPRSQCQRQKNEKRNFSQTPRCRRRDPQDI